MLLAIAVVDLADALRPGGGPTVTAVVARHDLVAGQTITASDVELRAVPTGWLPDGTLHGTDLAVGATVTSDVRDGEVITDARVSSGFGRALASGEVAAPVRLADGGVVDVLSAGQVVDLVASRSDGTSRTIVTDARVIAVPGADPVDPMSGVLVVLAVPAGVAAEVVGAGQGGALSVVLH